MKIKKGEWFLGIFTAVYIIAFALYYLSIKDYEFMWYIFVMLFFVILIVSTLRKTNFDYITLWGLSLWGLVHMIGGGVPVNGTVVYGLEIIRLFNIGDTYVLKMDQVIHAFGFGVATLVAYQLLHPRVKRMNKGLLYGMCFFMAIGAGALNEVVEFLAAVFIPSTGVGGYYNNSLDLVFNSIGSLIALVFIHFKYKV